MVSFGYSSALLLLWVHCLIYITHIQSYSDSGLSSLSAEIEDRNPCSFRGHFLLHKQSVTLDPCTVCTCDNGTTSCSIRSCPAFIDCPPGDIAVDLQVCCPWCTRATNDEMECSVGEQTHPHGEQFWTSTCTKCTCNNGTVSCVRKKCPETECPSNETVVMEGVCCPLCPYKIYVEEIINQYTSPRGVMDGQLNEIMFVIDVLLDKTTSPNVIEGERFWKLSAWVSRNEDGSGRKYSLVDQVYSGHLRQYRLPGRRPLGWSSLCMYDMELGDGSCDDYRYFCVKFGRQDRPYSGLTVLAVGNDESRLIDCVPLGECSDVRGDANNCSYKFSRFLHGEYVRMEPCTLCTCNNGTMLCDTERCPSNPRCRDSEMSIIPGECCPLCPYKLYVEGTFNMFSDRFGFSDGDIVTARFPLYVKVNRGSSSRYVEGRNLWKLTAWVSRRENGSGQMYSVVEQVFGKRGAAKVYRNRDYIVWRKLKYVFEFFGGTCDDYKYFCVKFDRGDDPQPKFGLNFTFRTTYDNGSRLISCAPLGNCHETAIFQTNVTTVSPSAVSPSPTVTVSMLGILLVSTVFIACSLILWRKNRRRSRDHRARRMIFINKMKDQRREVDESLKHKEVPHEFVRTKEQLGKGEFGEVYKGLLKVAKKGRLVDKVVAVKTAKACNAARRVLLREMKLIANLGEHPNILHLIACCSAFEPFYLITEFMRYGDLLGFMRKSRVTEIDNIVDPIYNVGEKELLIIARDIAKGMAYVHAKQFYHGDLAARNVLIGDKLSVKISDFGMAEDLYSTRSYHKQWKEQKIPIKWCSIETIQNGICSSQGDVWSFGILLYEVFTYGDTPYPGVAPRFLVTQLRRGYRMEQPTGCPDDVYDMMSRCWLTQPDDRPEFSLIDEQLADMLMERTDYMEFEATDADNGGSCVGTPPLERKHSTTLNDDNNEIEMVELRTVVVEDDEEQC